MKAQKTILKDQMTAHTFHCTDLLGSRWQVNLYIKVVTHAFYSMGAILYCQ